MASVRTNTGNNGLTYVTLNARDLSVLKWGDAAPDSAPAEADNPSSPAPAAEYSGSESESGFVTMDEDEEMVRMQDAGTLADVVGFHYHDRLRHFERVRTG